MGGHRFSEENDTEDFLIMILGAGARNFQNETLEGCRISFPGQKFSDFRSIKE